MGLSSKAGAVEEEAESILRHRPRHQHNGHAVSLADHCSALSPLCLCGSSFLHDGQRLGAHSGLQWVLRQPNLQVEKNQLEIFLRPYGFGSWGVGSVGFGNKMMVSNRPNSLYGGYT